MRKFIVAILSLSSVMLHAQASSPAQTQVATNGPSASQAYFDRSNRSQVDLQSRCRSRSTSTARLLNNDCKVVVGMIVDKTGKPSDLKIVQSAGTGVDASVLAAVSQYRFIPGMVSNQPIATPLNLEILIANSYR